MANKIKHLLYTPFTGLGKFDGFRGNRWLKNRITVFKEYVVPSLQAQTEKNFTLWISWRREEKNNPLVKDLIRYLESIKEFQTVHTFSGVCFYDDKYPESEARERLVMALQGAIGDLINIIDDCWHVYMTIQPSDDCYSKDAVKGIQAVFREHPHLEAVGFTKGYICNYNTKEISEYNPKTNPPFYTIKFQREQFIEPLKHLKYTALKSDADKYKKGTPLPSHEYIPLCFKYGAVDQREFLVGTHGENISTYYDHPYKGEKVNPATLARFGIDNSPKVKFRLGWKRWILKKLPHKIRRKVRYWFTEKLYDFLRS